jgi:hypothetical protein
MLVSSQIFSMVSSLIGFYKKKPAETTVSAGP